MRVEKVSSEKVSIENGGCKTDEKEMFRIKSML